MVFSFCRCSVPWRVHDAKLHLIYSPSDLFHNGVYILFVFRSMMVEMKPLFNARKNNWIELIDWYLLITWIATGTGDGGWDWGSAYIRFERKFVTADEIGHRSAIDCVRCVEMMVFSFVCSFMAEMRPISKKVKPDDDTIEVAQKKMYTLPHYHRWRGRERWVGVWPKHKYT